MDKDTLLFEKMNQIYDNKFDFMIKSFTNQFESNVLESQYKIIKESGTKEDLFYLYTEAKEDFKEKMLSVIKKIRDEIINFINKISYNVSKFMTSLQLKFYSKNVENIENFLINKIGLNVDEATKYTARFSVYAAILEKKMMIYDKFTLMVEQKNARGESITEKELDRFEKAITEVDLQFRDQKKIIRPQYTTWNLYKKSFNPEFYKFMSLKVDKSYSAIRNKINNDADPTIISRLTTFFKQQFNDISSYLKNTTSALNELKEIERKYHISKDTTREQKMAETMYILNELDRIDIQDAKMRNRANQIRVQADALNRMGYDYDDPDLLAQAELLRDEARIAQREADYYTRNNYNTFYNYY